ncbi:MAG: hypothetical protein M3O82_06675 [Verrucomicrobiota bacterium]|nr:hypothetical protein [Verrucomicrobiota bacterium]
MKNILLLISATILLAACEAKVETPAAQPAEKNTTIVNPPAEKTEEKNTTIVNPPASKTEEKTTTTTETK